MFHSLVSNPAAADMSWSKLLNDDQSQLLTPVRRIDSEVGVGAGISSQRMRNGSLSFGRQQQNNNRRNYTDSDVNSSVQVTDSDDLLDLAGHDRFAKP